MYAVIIFGLAFIYYAYPACVDLTNSATGISDCSRLSYLCNNSVYYTLMTQQCPATCGRCSTTTNTSTTTTCVDLTNPSTGVSDCSSRAYLCNNSIYYTLMTQQCPATCGRCTSTNTTSTSTSTSTCGTDSRCSSWVTNGFCNSTFYTTAQKTSFCGVACGLCTSGKK